MVDHWMKDIHWLVVHYLAADLSKKRVSPNQLQSTAAYIRNQNPTHRDLIDWFDSQIDHANVFPRTNRSLFYIYAVCALVKYLRRLKVKDNDSLVELLNWIAKLMSYYTLDENRHERDKAIKKWGQNPRLEIPKSESVSLSYRPKRAAAAQKPAEPVDDLPEVRDEDEVSDLANDFMAFLRKKQQGDDEK